VKGEISLPPMRIGIFGGEPASIDAGVSAAKAAAEQGFSGYWVSQIFGFDALSVLAIVGREVPGIEVGTAVVPTFPRHPMMLAQQALTVNAAAGGRLVLGIGLSHQIVIEQVLGLSFEKPLRHMREYLSILMPLIQTGSVSFQGETLSANASITVPGSSPCPVLVAALGPKMLELAGTLADGTMTWMTGCATLGSLTVPTITKATTAAGRPAPRIGAGMPVCVTDDEAEARARAAQIFQVYGVLPSYRAMLDREGCAGPEDLAIVGTEAEVRTEIGKLADVGVTDFAAVEFGAGEAETTRTRELLRSLL
jgi:F420-dependent oxidoreductase-like protein